MANVLTGPRPVSGMLPSNSSNDDLNVSWLNNAFTGRRDYARQKELLNLQNAFSASEAQKARDWTERMSNTAYQRAMSDARTAGLNPLLVVANGAASTPAAAAASSTTAPAHKSGEQGLAFINTLINNAFDFAKSTTKSASKLLLR